MSLTHRVQRVPIADPSRAVQAQGEDLAKAFSRFLASGRYIHGPEHAAFEEEFADFLRVRHCIGVGSGTDAIELALLAVGCQAGDEILTAGNCGGYSGAAARRAGLRVRLADVDPGTLGLSAATVEAALSPETRAVVVTHLYGLLADIEGITSLCRQRGVAVIEDCAQAAGAQRGGLRAGAFADAAAFSFYPTKNLAALGDGGAVVTSNDQIAGRVRELRQYGWDTKYHVATRGGRNSRLDELQAAVLRIRLGRLDVWNQRRREIVNEYSDALPPAAGRFVASPAEDFVGHLAVVVAEHRADVRTALEGAGVGTDVHYPVADHRQPAWLAEYTGVGLPITEYAVEHVLSVPCFPELTDAEISHVCEALRGL